MVGNHEHKMDDQYLHLIRKTGVAKRLDKWPTLLNDEGAIYGIDAVTRLAWHAKDVTLESLQRMSSPFSVCINFSSPINLVIPPVQPIWTTS